MDDADRAAIERTIAGLETQVAALRAVLASGVRPAMTGPAQRLIPVGDLAKRRGTGKKAAREWAERRGALVWIRRVPYVDQDLLE